MSKTKKNQHRLIGVESALKLYIASTSISYCYESSYLTINGRGRVGVRGGVFPRGECRYIISRFLSAPLFDAQLKRILNIYKIQSVNIRFLHNIKKAKNDFTTIKLIYDLSV